MFYLIVVTEFTVVHYVLNSWHYIHSIEGGLRKRTRWHKFHSLMKLIAFYIALICRKGLNSIILSLAMSKIVDQIEFFSLCLATRHAKEFNSDFKPVRLRLKIYLVSHFDYVDGFVNIYSHRCRINEMRLQNGRWTTPPASYHENYSS